MQPLYRPAQSLFHQMDARVKIIFTLAFILSLSLTPPGAWPAYILYLSVALCGALLSKLGILFVQKRAFLAVPIILAALPLVFWGPLPHHPLAEIAGMQLIYSPAGLTRFASIAVKSWISIQAAILLAATSEFPDLLAAMRKLHVPKIFVAIIALMWRYLFVMEDEAARLMRARRSRSAFSGSGQPSGGNFVWNAQVTGGMAGSLFLRSLERADRVYAAMRSRGYNGEPLSADSTPLSRSDLITLTRGLILVVALFITAFFTGG